MQTQTDIVHVKYTIVFIQFTTVHTWYSINYYSIVRALYIQLHVVTGILNLGYTYRQIVFVQFDNNVICKA